MEKERRATFRVPEDVQRFLAIEARRNCTSQNAEVIRAVRERMERANKTGPEGAVTPTGPDHQPRHARTRSMDNLDFTTPASAGERPRLPQGPGPVTLALQAMRAADPAEQRLRALRRALAERIANDTRMLALITVGEAA